MIDHSFVWIDGSPGSGKTTLIERALEANRKRSIGVVRLHKNPKLRAPKEIVAGNEETRRYLKAGADEVLLMQYPDNNKTSVADEYWCSDFHANLFNSVYFEAELGNDQFAMNLNIFVMSALQDPMSIFEFSQFKVDEKYMMDRLIESFAHLAPVFNRFGRSLEDLASEAIAKSSTPIDAIEPVTIQKLAPGFEGLNLASTVVVNIQNASERPAAEQLVKYIKEQDSKFTKIEPSFGYLWRPKRWQFICNLNDPKDSELKKLISKIKRQFVER